MLKIIIWCEINAGSENSNSSVMVVHFKQADTRVAANAFTLPDVLIAIVVLVLIMSGLMYGYVQLNRMALWSSMSLAAQSIASQGAEAARCAKWDTQVPGTNTGPNTQDELSPLQSPWSMGSILKIKIRIIPWTFRHPARRFMLRTLSPSHKFKIVRFRNCDKSGRIACGNLLAQSRVPTPRKRYISPTP